MESVKAPGTYFQCERRDLLLAHRGTNVSPPITAQPHSRMDGQDSFTGSLISCVLLSSEGGMEERMKKKERGETSGGVGAGFKTCERL